MARSSRIEFCCCAIPLVNVGAYTICLEFMLVSLCIIILAVAPPQIVATMGALPAGFPKIIVAVLGVLAFLWQIVGLSSIKQQKTSLYRTYIRINFLLVLVTIIATLAFFAVAAARHNTALAACTAAYGSAPQGSSSSGSTGLQDVGSKICNIFIWVQVGFCGLLIALIGVTQLYMSAVQRAYGQEMRRAEQDSKTQMGGVSGDEIPLATRGSGIWDAPATTGTHYNAESASISDDGNYGGKSGAYGARPNSGYGTNPYESYGMGGNNAGYGRRQTGDYGQDDGYGHHRGASKQSAYYYAS